MLTTFKDIQLLSADLIKRIGNGPATKYTIKIESIEFLTQLQIAMEDLKKNLT